MGSPVGMAFSPDGRTLAIGYSDGRVRLLDVATRQMVLTLAAASSPIDGVAFSPDGKILAARSLGGPVRLWDLATGRPVGRPLTDRTGTAVPECSQALSPDGRFLAARGRDGTVRLRDVVNTDRPVYLYGSTPYPSGMAPPVARPGSSLTDCHP